jgi:hypothetical protein
MEIPDEVILNLHEVIDFPIITTTKKLNEELIRKFFNKIPLINLLSNQSVPLDILDPLISSNLASGRFDNTYWYYVWKFQKINVDFIYKYINYADWNAISSNKKALTLEIINAFHNDLIWHEMTSHGLHELIIRHFIHKLNSISWANISWFSTLSCEFIFEYKDKLNILAIFSSQKLSEELICILLKNINDEITLYDVWNKISSTQELSRKFIEENKDNLNIKSLIRNRLIKRKDLKKVYKLFE